MSHALTSMLSHAAQAASFNHALQRTAPHVTAPVPTVTLPPTVQVPRRHAVAELGHFAKK